MEIMREIFSSSVSSEPCVPSRQTAPLNVSQVCRDWRADAVMMPGLWSTLKLSNEGGLKDKPSKIKAIMNILSSWLDRSRNQALTFDVTLDCSHFQKEKEGDTYVAVEVLTKMLQNRARWKDVALNFKFAAPRVIDFEALRNVSPVERMPRLERLHLEIQGIPKTWFIWESITSWMKFGLASSPSLNTLSGNIPFGIDAGQESLKSYTYNSTGITRRMTTKAKHCLDILRSATNLEEFRASGIGIGTSTEAIDLLVATKLRILDLTSAGNLQDSNDNAVSYILDRLETPQLRELKIKTIEETDIEIFGPLFERFVDRSSHSIQHLNLTVSDILEGPLIAALRLLPRLKSLEVQYAQYLTGSILSALTLDSSPENDSGSLCPELESIVFVGTSCFVNCQSMVDDLIFSRWNTERRQSRTQRVLKKVLFDRCDFGWDLNEQEVSAAEKIVNRYRSEGLEIKITYLPEEDY